VAIFCVRTQHCCVKCISTVIVLGMRERSGNILFIATIVATAIVAMLASLIKYWYFGDYHILVEASCDPQSSICFTRDCSTDECPPNELETYKIFRLKATTLPHCETNECLNICSDPSVCEEIICGSGSEDTCINAERQEI
jgi:hypothetical protein